MGNEITYTITAVVSNAPLTSDLVLSDDLGTGLAFGSVISAGPFTVDPSGAPLLELTLPAGTPPGTYEAVYTAQVTFAAGATVGNVVTIVDSDDGASCFVCSTSHPVQPSFGQCDARLFLAQGRVRHCCCCRASRRCTCPSRCSRRVMYRVAP